MDGVDGSASRSQRFKSISARSAPGAPRCPAFKPVSSSFGPLSVSASHANCCLSFSPCSLSSPRSRLSARLLPPPLITSLALARLLHRSHTTRHAMANSQGTGTTLSDNSRSDLVEKPEDALPQLSDLTPPDGGLAAWLTVAGACVAFAGPCRCSVTD